MVCHLDNPVFKDKTIAGDARRKLFLGLVRASIIFDMAGPRIANTKTIDYLVPGGFLPPQQGFPIHPKNVELAKENHTGFGPVEIPANEVFFMKQIEGVLSKPILNAYQVRWAVEVRQKQLALTRSRDIPASVKTSRHERDTDENIQIKRTHRE